MRSALNFKLPWMMILVATVIFLFCHIPLAYTMDVTLEWSENSEPDIAGYKIYYSTGSAGSPYDGTGAVEGNSPIDAGKVTSYTLTGLSDTQSYRFAVTAYDTQGLESEYSNEVRPIKITGITSPYNGLFTVGEDIPITINFSEPVTLANGNLIVTLNTGHIAEITPFTSLTSKNVNYVIQTGDTTNDLNVTSLTLSIGATLGNDSGSICYLLLPSNNNLADNTDIILDTTAPSAPADMDLAADDDSGISDSDNVTRNTSGLTITGSGEDLAMVRLYDNGIAMSGATGMVSSIGFSLDIALSAGAHVITARQIDAAGNVSDPSPELHITVDTTAPEVALSLSKPGPYRPQDEVEITATLSEEISDTPQLTVTYAAADVVTANMTATGDSKVWVHSITIPSGYEGAPSILFMGSDRAGNMVESHAGYLFSVDNTAPSIQGHPVVDFSNKTIDITYSEASLAGVTNEARYSFSPSLSFASSGESNDIACLSGSTYRLSLSSIPAGKIYTLTISGITDAAGNPLSPASVVINDNDADQMADDWEIAKGVSNPTEDADNDGLTNLQEFTLGTEPGSSDTDSDGFSDGWEVAYALSPLSAAGIDGPDGDLDHDGWSNREEYLAGTNPNDSSSIILDTTAPSAPADMDLAADDDSGISDSDNVTRNTSGLTITGSGEDLAMVRLYDNGIAMSGATGMVSSIGFSLDIALSAGAHVITARQIDAAGNVSDPSPELHITVDTTAPEVALSLSKPGPYRPQDEVEITATLSEEISDTPQLTVTYAAADVVTANMTATGDSKVWVHSITIPSGYEGAPSILFMGSDRAGNMVESHAGYLFSVDNTAPSIQGHPVVDFSNKTIDITYSEASLAGVTNEARYSFSPSLSFASSGESNDIACLSGSTYRLSLSSIPAGKIYTLTISGITDAAGNPLSPASVVINDNDADQMADDWEIAKGVSNPTEDADNDGLSNLQEFALGTEPGSSDTDSDGFSDGWEVAYALSPLSAAGIDGPDGDLDHDGWSNREEYLNGTTLNDDTSPLPTPPKVKKNIPEGKKSLKRSKAGDSENARIPDNTSFCVLLEDQDGIDLTDTTSVKFTIIAGDGAPYERDLSSTDVVRTVKLNSLKDDTRVTRLWVVYDRSQEKELGNFPYGQDITFLVDAKDRRQDWMTQASFTITIETEQEHADAQASMPDTRALEENDPALEGEYNTGIQAGSSDLIGAKICYNSSEPVAPAFGPVDELPSLTVDGMEAVGTALNFDPPTVFSTPVKVFIPCPEQTDVSKLSIFLHTDAGWVLGCDAEGNVQPDGEAWMVPGSRVNHNDTVPPAIEIKVYHFSGLQAGKESAASPNNLLPGDGEEEKASPDGNEGETPDVGKTGCFINSLRGFRRVFDPDRGRGRGMRKH
ncbi:MAG: Ig-like domain-containing protein [bacterium]